MVNRCIAMDDEGKEYRNHKRPQKIYRPGSGPLRRSSYGLDMKMDAYGVDNKPRSREHSLHGSYNSVSDAEAAGVHREQSATNSRARKPQQQLYVPRSGDAGSDLERQSRMSIKCDNSSRYKKRMPSKQDKQPFSSGTGSYSGGGSRKDFQYREGANNDINYNRQYRPTSESRSISPMRNIQEQQVPDRNRDSRSMETSGRSMGGGGGKPPSGRRNSAGYSSDSGRSKFINLDNIPPRFRKKYLEQQASHQGFDALDQVNRDRPPVYSAQVPYNQNVGYPSSGWSQTLPSRGRGRLRDNPLETFDRDKFIHSLKGYEVQNSRKSTPSNSYLNLYELNTIDNRQLNYQNPLPDVDLPKDFQKAEYDATKNGTSNVSSDHEISLKHESDNESETISQISSQIIDMTLDWTEEVEKNIKLDDICDTPTSFSQNPTTSSTNDVKAAEPRDSKKSGRSRRRDKRSSSRGKRSERNRKDSNVSVQHEPERIRRDSNVSIQNETISASLLNRERERRDSHRSNRSSNLGNSRDDLDRWRSLRSYSREHSAERRIVSQCNSRDTSVNRGMSTRDNDGFRIPSAAPKSGAWPTPRASNQPQKKNGSWVSGRTPSIERGRQSPAPNAPEGGEGGGGGRRGRKKASRRRGGKHADVPPPTSQPPGATPAPTNLNWREEILESKKHTNDNRQSERSQRSRVNSAMSDKSVSESSTSTAHPGIIILPQSTATHLQKDQGRSGTVENQKLLYDPQNPSKPIVVQTNSLKVDTRMERSVQESSLSSGSGPEPGDAARAARHRALLQEVDRADAILRTHALRGPLVLAQHWNDVIDTRKFLQSALQRLLTSDLKYCQADNVEHNFWKILYYNFIESLRKSFSQMSPEDKPKIVKLINLIIEEGNEYFENLVHLLEKTYKFNTDDYINDNHLLPPKGLGYVGLALISVQKLYVFLGDLARYKEQVNETNNYSKSKFWYTKAQQINPKNGRPYNQLAILAIYARRKLDAVYYYMRSLMSSNPFHSARESLLSLFDENSKKYEAAERKRRAAAEVTSNGEQGEAGHSSHQSLRREVWVRPSGHRTTTVQHHSTDELLTSMTPVELNKTFITSYLHVHGKLITKIGMETFHASASQMVRQFTALLHRQPLPTPAARLLHLTALNMFAVETTAATRPEGGERSAWLECALGVALLMFGAMLERCCALLPEPADSQHHADALLLLPAIKVWSDWMLCHSSVWNPPPALDNFEVESPNDPWDWLAKLMNILEELDDKSIQFETEMKEGLVPVRLPEDASLAGFTPLMYMEPAAAWRDAAMAPHAAEHLLRARKLLFFGTEYLVGVEPPVLKLECPPEAPPRYVSAVLYAPAHHAQHTHTPEDSGDETASGALSGPASLSELEAVGADEATRRLLRRKEQLETRNATMDRRRQHVHEILVGGGGCVRVEVEVRPRWLVPDTNCFIDHLALLRALAAAPHQPYLLAVPLVVMSELEGLCRCSRVGERARSSLSWVSGGAAGVRLATSRGSLLASRAFTAERAASGTNDDRVLATALNLHANLASEPDTPRDEGRDEQCVKRVREVVLLTDDRNLRVKALAAELPARDLPSFIQWAGLDPTSDSTKGVNDAVSGPK